MNPFGNLPVRAFGPHVIMDTNDRFQMPAVVRTRAFDSIVVGTSSSKLLDPAWLEQAFGGRFANIALNDGRAWEEYQLALLFLAPCRSRDTAVRHRLGVVRGGRRRQSHHAARLPALDLRRGALERLALYPELAEPGDRRPPARQPGRAVAAALSGQWLRRVRAARAAYDAGQGASSISGAARASPIVPHEPAYVATDSDLAQWRYPALAWLDELAGKTPAGTRVIFAFMPAHVAGQPQPGSKEAAREAECKARMAAIAARRGAHLVDFKIASSITREDANYWDPLHYRLPIAQRIVEGIARAVATGKDDPGGDWRYLAGPAR